MTIQLILGIFASTGFWSLINTVYLNRKKSKSVEDKAIMALLHDKIYYLCDKHISNGYISQEDYENLIYLYEPYKELGGNGTCKKLMAQIEKLEFRNRKE